MPSVTQSPPLTPRLAAHLATLYAGGPQTGVDGKPHPIDAVTRIAPEQGMLLRDLVLGQRPQFTLEIGLAYGFSSLYILDALETLGVGHHFALDPYQRSYWHGIALAHVEAAGAGDRFTFIEERAAHALPRFLELGIRPGVIFIDGDHKFDSAFVDFYFAAQLCPPGGVIVLDDMWMPAIRRVTAFIEANRHDFTREASDIDNVAIFRRTGEDARSWDHYVPF